MEKREHPGFVVRAVIGLAVVLGVLIATPLWLRDLGLTPGRLRPLLTVSEIEWPPDPGFLLAITAALMWFWWLYLLVVVTVRWLAFLLILARPRVRHLGWLLRISREALPERLRRLIDGTLLSLVLAAWHKGFGHAAPPEFALLSGTSMAAGLVLAPRFQDAGRRIVAMAPEDRPLRLVTLGDYRVWIGPEPAPRLRPKGLELLAYVVTNRDVAVSRDQIMEALWPGDDLTYAAKVFSVTLAKLRRDLLGAGLDHDGLLVCESGFYRLVPDLVWIDAEAFEEGILRAQRTAAEDALAKYLEALELYRGEYLAPAYYPWVTPERSRLAGLFEDAVMELAELLLGAGRTADAVGLLRAALARDPLNDYVKERLAAVTG